MIAAREPEGLLLGEAGCTLGGAGRGRGKADGSLAGEWELQEWGRDGVWSQGAPGRDALCFSSALLSVALAGVGYVQVGAICMRSSASKAGTDLLIYRCLKLLGEISWVTGS